MQINREKARILITARDPSAASSVSNLLKTLSKDNRFDISVAAQQPAYEIIYNYSVIDDIRLIKVPTIFNEDKLLIEADNLIKRISPDIILTSLSGPDYGIDEAVLAISPENNCGPYSLQAYWGDINENLQAKAKTYFVIDRFAANITQKRISAKTCVVGSLKHEAYADIHPKAFRDKFRKELNVRQSDYVIGFYGQPLNGVKGYKETVSSFSKSVSEVKKNVIIVYRPHPKESLESKKWTEKQLRLSGKPFKMDIGIEIEPGLCGADLIVSAFSTCCYDAQQMIRVSSEPLGIPVYLRFNLDLVSWYEKHTHLEKIPMTGSEMAIEITDSKVMTVVLENALEKRKQRDCWASIHKRFPATVDTSRNIANVMYKNFIDEN